MIPLLQTKTAHAGIFASNTWPLSRYLGGAWGRGYQNGARSPSLYSGFNGDLAMLRRRTLNGGRETNAPIRSKSRAQLPVRGLKMASSVQTNVQRNSGLVTVQVLGLRRHDSPVNRFVVSKCTKISMG